MGAAAALDCCIADGRATEMDLENCAQRQNKVDPASLASDSMAACPMAVLAADLKRRRKLKVMLVSMNWWKADHLIAEIDCR